MEVKTAIDAVSQDDKRKLLAMILGKSSEEIDVEIPWSITEDWWGIGPIDHAMDTVVDSRDGVDFYDECMMSRMEDEVEVEATVAGSRVFISSEPPTIIAPVNTDANVAEYIPVEA